MAWLRLRSIAAVCAIVAAAMLSASSPMPAGAAAALPQPGGSSSAYLAKLYAIAKTEGELTIYSAFPVSVLAPMVKAFESKYPGIRVSHLFLRTAPLFTRIEAEFGSGRNTFDAIVHPWSPDWFELSNKGILASYPAMLASEYPKSSWGPNKTWLDIWFGPQVIGYNTTVLAAGDVPKRWKDLTKTQYAGKWALATPVIRGGAYWWFYAMNQLYGPQFLADLAKTKPMVEDGPTAVVAAVASGQVALGVGGDYDFYVEKAKGAPVGVVYPEDGVFLQTRSMALAARAPHPAAARLFFEWLAGTEGASVARDTVGLYSFNPRVGPPAGRPPISKFKIVPVDTKKFAQDEERITQLATDAFGAK